MGLVFSENLYQVIIFFSDGLRSKDWIEELPLGVVPGAMASWRQEEWQSRDKDLMLSKNILSGNCEPLTRCILELIWVNKRRRCRILVLQYSY